MTEKIIDNHVNRVIDDSDKIISDGDNMSSIINDNKQLASDFKS